MGILEEINAKLDRILAAQGTGNVAQQAAAVQQQQAAADPFASLGGAQQTPAAPANVTADDIMKLITPHISNEAVKAKLGEALKAMGVDNLNNLQPGQYGDAYARFQQVIAGAATGGGASII